MDQSRIKQNSSELPSVGRKNDTKYTKSVIDSHRLRVRVEPPKNMGEILKIQNKLKDLRRGSLSVAKGRYASVRSGRKHSP